MKNCSCSSMAGGSQLLIEWLEWLVLWTRWVGCILKNDHLPRLSMCHSDWVRERECCNGFISWAWCMLQSHSPPCSTACPITWPKKKKTLKLNKVVFQLNFRLFFTLSSLFFHYFTNPASSFSFTATLLSRLFHVLTSQLRGLIWSILCLHSLFLLFLCLAHF